MDINIRRTGEYADVTTKEGNTQIEMGLLNLNERRELVTTLLNAAGELLYLDPDCNDISDLVGITNRMFSQIIDEESTS